MLSQMKNNYHHPTFIQYKRSLINLFSLRYEKKLHKRKRKKFKRKKNKNINLN